MGREGYPRDRWREIERRGMGRNSEGRGIGGRGKEERRTFE